MSLVEIGMKKLASKKLFGNGLGREYMASVSWGHGCVASVSWGHGCVACVSWGHGWHR